MQFGGVICIDDEGELINTEANGYVEFVLKALEVAVVFIVEAKMSDLAKGQGQIAMELAGTMSFGCS